MVAKDVCLPLGLTDTGIALAAQSERLAQGHTGRLRPTPPWTFNALARAGAWRSTAADMLAFVRAQLDGGVGEIAEAIRLSRQVQHRINRWSWTHPGWMGLRLPPGFGSVDQIWHNGGTGGFRSWVRFIPDKRAAVVVLSNTARPIEGRAFDLLRVLAFGGSLRGAR